MLTRLCDVWFLIADVHRSACGFTIVPLVDDLIYLPQSCRRSEAWKSFLFDRVWKADANQAEVFADIEPMVISVLGTAFCAEVVFSYGAQPLLPC
jgi:hypothetical protein